MSNRRFTRKLRRQAGGKPYRESQLELLCGKHAINHLLQEPKFVWDADNNSVFIPSKPDNIDENEHARDPKVKINLFADCKEQDSKQQEEFSKKNFEGELAKLFADIYDDPPLVLDESKIVIDDARRKQYKGKTDEEIIKVIEKARKEEFEKQKARRKQVQEKYKDKSGNIDSLTEAFRFEYEEGIKKEAKPELCEYGKGEQGNIDISIFDRWRKTLGYGGLLIDTNDVDKEYLVLVIIKFLEDKLEERDDLLGVMFVTGKHYYALVLYDGECDKREGKERLYALVDPLKYVTKDGVCKLKRGKEKCYTRKELTKEINNINPTGALFFFSKRKDGKENNPYKSVSYLRMKGLKIENDKRNNSISSSSSKSSTKSTSSSDSDPTPVRYGPVTRSQTKTKKVQFNPIPNIKINTQNNTELDNDRASVTAIKG